MAEAIFVDIEVTVAQVSQVTLDEAGVVLGGVRNFPRRVKVPL